MKEVVTQWLLHGCTMPLSDINVNQEENVLIQMNHSVCEETCVLHHVYIHVCAYVCVGGGVGGQTSPCKESTVSALSAVVQP